MAEQKNEHSGVIYGEVKSLIGEMGKLVKIMIERTAQADAIIARDKLERELAEARQAAGKHVANARTMGADAVRDVRENPVPAAITFAACGWMAWLLLKSVRK